VKAVGRSGNGIGEFDTPTSILAESLDDFLVVDTRNNRLQQFLRGSSE
jgi:hypothetical protein